MTRLALILTTAALPVLAAGSAVACDKAVKQTAQLVPASAPMQAVTYQAMLPAAVASSVEMGTPPESETTDEDGEVMSDSDTVTDYSIDTESSVTTTPNSDVAGDVEIYEPGLTVTEDDGLTGENADTLADDDADVAFDTDESETSDDDVEDDEDEAAEPLFAPED